MPNGRTEVQSKRVPKVRRNNPRSRPVQSNNRVPNVRPSGDKDNGGGAQAGEVRTEQTQHSEVGYSASAQAKDFCAQIDWKSIPVGEGESIIIAFVEAIERGRVTLRDRISDALKADMRCSNPACMKPIKDEKACASIYTELDVLTRIARNVYSCSPQCNSINSAASRQKRVVTR